MCLPMPLGDTGAIVNEPMPAKEEVECVAWRWEEVRTALHMHGTKREMIQTERGKAAYQARRERLEARMKREKEEFHD
ncbi:MAG: hypothetical protein P8X95_28545 [Anaerolineales bacterium]